MMDVEKLIDRLKECGTYGFKQEECREAAEALATLQIELKAMRGAANSYKAENARLESELEKVKAERDAAIKTIFQWTGCPECKWWDSADEWCEKHDREADSCGGCDSPEWRGQKEE